MDPRLQVKLFAALVPVVIGAIWYNPYLFGKLWGNSIGLTAEKTNAARLALIVVITYLAGYYIAGSLGSIVIHQRGIYSMLAGNPDMQDKGSALYNTVQGLMDKYGHNFRTFKHGALHGSFTGLYLVLPVLVMIALLERKRITWVLIHGAFWVMSLAVMGGIICEYMP